VFGGTWEISDVLDDTHQSDPSPEALVSNGSKTAAIEVKRLIGDDEYLTYIESMFSLEKYLTPSCGGHYSLGTALDFRLPMEPRFRRHVKKEVERVAPTLAPEQTGAIRIPRQAHVSLIKDSGPGYIYCCHTSTGHFVQEVSSRLAGVFLLVDDGQWEHEFVTEEAKKAFQEALVAACEIRLQGDLAPFAWTEEWPLTRGSDEGTQSGVWLIAVTGARSVQGSVAEAVDIMLEKAKQKFEERRWAELHVLVFDNASALMTVDRVAEVVAGFEPEDLGAIDVILVADEDVVAQVWPLPAQASSH
jgi:hypothetical protein